MNLMMVLLWTSLCVSGLLAIKLGLESDGLQDYTALLSSVFCTVFVFILLKFQFGYMLSVLELLGVYFSINFSLRSITWLVEWKDIKNTNKVIKERFESFK